MTDKVQKIREEVEIVVNRRLNLLNGDYFDLNKEADGFTNEIMDIINSLQEEPISVWHNMDEVPIKGEVILVQTKDTFYGVSVQKGGTTYKNRNKDRYVRWAYTSDLLNLSNVQRTVKDWKEEPVSDELEKAAGNYAFTMSGEDEVSKYYAFLAGANWQKSHLWKPADGDDLPEIDREVIALLDNGKVVFAHRPNPEGWDAVSIITEKVEHYIPETYGKGGWNIPNIMYWLDVKLPKEIEL